jgi:hypothetical protein
MAITPPLGTSAQPRGPVHEWDHRLTVRGCILAAKPGAGHSPELNPPDAPAARELERARCLAPGHGQFLLWRTTTPGHIYPSSHRQRRIPMPNDKPVRIRSLSKTVARKSNACGPKTPRAQTRNCCDRAIPRTEPDFIARRMPALLRSAIFAGPRPESDSASPGGTRRAGSQSFVVRCSRSSSCLSGRASRLSCISGFHWRDLQHRLRCHINEAYFPCGQ